MQALENYRDTHPAESDLVEDFLRFLSNPKEHPFHRSNRARHITASAWLVSQTGDEVLLTHHRKLNCWLQLGGHCDGSDHVLGAAIREAEEESGIQNIQAISEDIFDIDKHLIPARLDEPEHFHYDIRFLLLAPRKEFSISEESKNLKWFHCHDDFFKTPKAQSLRRLHLKWLGILEPSFVRALAAMREKLQGAPVSSGLVRN
jgi:8-oxo-dGTP pyrophosphatase MutT (NUDIX family)